MSEPQKSLKKRRRVTTNAAWFKPVPAEIRFLEKWTPEPFSGCWLWIGATVASPGPLNAVKLLYGVFYLNSSLKRAHRASWELFRGQIAVGMNVLHKCDTSLCVNPEHLFLGTAKDNTRDAFRKGRLGFDVNHNFCGRGKVHSDNKNYAN